MNTPKVLSVVSAFIVRDTQGEIDWESTMLAVRSAAEAEMREAAQHDAAIEAALHSLFDRLPAGTAVKTDIATQACAAALAGGDFAALIEWTGRIEDYLTRSPHFKGQRGRSGGLKRIS